MPRRNQQQQREEELAMEEGGTRLVEIETSDPSKAAQLFSQIDDDGNTPIVLLPKRRSTLAKCCWPWEQVPSDAFVMMQSFGKNTPEGQVYDGSGRENLGPFKHMAYLVTRSACTYNAPVNQCPTRDNISVSIDLSIVFTIGNPYAFVYELGTLRFDEYLKSSVNEGIRVMIRDVNANQLFDLRSSFASKMLENLNAKFEPVGVTFTQVNITDVKLPGGLFQLLQHIQELKSRAKEEQANHDFEMQKTRGESEAAMRRIRQTNEFLSTELGAKKRRVAMQSKENLAHAVEKRDLAKQEIDRWAAMIKKKTIAQLGNQKLKVEEEAETRWAKCQAAAANRLLDAEQRAKTMVLEAEAAYRKASNDVKARLLAARAEEKAQESFKMRRMHELELKRMEVAKVLLSSSRIVLKGEEGSRLLHQMAGFSRSYSDVQQTVLRSDSAAAL